MRLSQPTDGVLAVILAVTCTFTGTDGIFTITTSPGSAKTDVDDSQLAARISTDVIPLIGLSVLIGSTLASDHGVLDNIHVQAVAVSTATPPNTGANANIRRSPPAAGS